MTELQNIYQKLQRCRLMLQDANLKKTGVNKFVGYKYYELSDLLPTINKLLDELKLCMMLSFTPTMAELKIINSENALEEIIFTSPMATAAVKGCYDIQNLGAVQTYLHRYLILAAFEVCENDMLDLTHNPDKKTVELVSKPQSPPVNQQEDNKAAYREWTATPPIPVDNNIRIETKAGSTYNEEATPPKICQKCGSRMTLRTATKGKNPGSKFWGCSNYPNCKQVEPY